MRLTIERIRTLVLAAAVLLLAGLAVFLWVGKGKNLFNRKDLPKRLGLNIQQEANGYTFVHAFGAHSQYRIHASREVQLKNDRVELHDVTIELFGADGSRADQIKGDEFEYDQKSGIATAEGPVDMLLTRPAATPTGSVKSVDQLAAVAESSGAGQVHVKTSGIAFDRNTGMVTTPRRVDFSMAQGSGSAMGASYDSQKGYLTLEQSVELTTHRGADPVEIRAQHAEFDRDTLLCRLRAATASYRDGQADAAQARILFRKDGSAAHLDATSGFTLATAAGGRLAAPTGSMDFDDHSQPRRGHLEGGVVIDSVREDRTAHGTAPTAELTFAAKGQLRHVHLERGVAMESEETSAPAGGQAALRVKRRWNSPVADVDFRDAGGGRVEAAAIRGTGGVVVTGETRRGNAAAAPSKMTADEVTGSFGAGSELRTLTGVGHAGIEETTAKGTRQTASADRLQARFAENRERATPASNDRSPGAPAGNKGTRERESKSGNSGIGASEVEWAKLDGHVSLFEQPAAKPGGKPQSPLRATAGKAVYEGAGEWVHLTIAPRVVNGDLELTAEKVDVSRQSGDAFAHGNVKATWSGEGGPASGAQNTAANGGGGHGGLTFGGSGPAHAIAAEAQVNESTGEATFRGHARLWQQMNSVAGPVIVLNQHAQTLEGHTTDPADPVKAALLNAGKNGGLLAGTNGGNKQTTPSVIRIRGGDLWYSNAERRAIMHGGVLGAVVAETGTATSSSDSVELQLLPAGNHGSGGQAQVDRMTAAGHVALASQGRRGTGEKLVYTGANENYVLTGTAAAPPKMTDPRRGAVTGEALIFNSRDDSVSIEGGGRETRTETAAPDAHRKK